MSGRSVAVVLLAGLAGGCQHVAPEARSEAVTIRAGEAIRANTVMQMVDPWQRGVENTDLVVPADVRQYQRNSDNADIGNQTTTMD